MPTEAVVTEYAALHFLYCHHGQRDLQKNLCHEVARTFLAAQDEEGDRKRKKKVPMGELEMQLWLNMEMTALMTLLG